MALAATVLLAVSLGGGGWLYVQQQAVSHLATITSNVNDRLSDARLHHQLAAAVDTSNDEGLKDRVRELSVALDSARAAANLAEETQVPTELGKSANKLLATIESEHAAADLAASEAAANRELKQKLELVRVSRAAGEHVSHKEEQQKASERFSEDGAPGAMIAMMDVVPEIDYSRIYRETFQEAGFNLLSGDADVAIDWIRQSPIRETLISAIDDWIRVSSEGIPPELTNLNWTIPRPSELIAAGASLQQQSDGSILASRPTSIEDDHFTIVLQPDAGPLTAIQLEMLTDDSLPNRGPGHHDPSGNFHLQEIKILLQRGDQPPVPIVLADAWASFSWQGRDISRAIDGDLKTEWHVSSRTGRDHQAVFSLEPPIDIATGDTLMIELHQQAFNSQDYCPLGKFRLSVTGETAEVRSRRLRHLADKADYSDWRRQLRSALMSDDLKLMRELATAGEARGQQPALVAWLGRSLRQRSARDTAIAVLESALRKYPQDLELNLELGQALIEITDRQPEGLGYLRTAVALQPKSPVPRKALAKAHDNLGQALRGQGKLDEAIAEYRKAIEIDKKFAAAHFNLGKALRDQGKLNEAIAEFRKAIEINPKNAPTHFNLGRIFSKQGNLDEAIAEYRKVIETDPRFPLAHFNLGVHLADLGKLDEAIAEYRKAIEVDPRYVPAHFNLGMALEEQGKLDDAIARYRKAIEVDPKLAPPHNALGIALWRQGKLDEAIAELRKAIEIDPKSARAHFNLGVALKRQGKLDEVIAEYRKAIEINPSYATAHNNLGQALRGQGKLDEAIAEYRKAIEIDPKSATAHNNLAWALSTSPDKEGQYSDAKQAVTWARRANELSPENGNYRNTLGVALYRAEQWQEAIDTLEKAITLGAEKPYSELFLAMAHWQLAQKDKARRWYEESLDWQTTNTGQVDTELQGFFVEAANLMVSDGNKEEQQVDSPRETSSPAPGNADAQKNTPAAPSPDNSSGAVEGDKPKTKSDKPENRLPQ